MLIDIVGSVYINSLEFFWSGVIIIKSIDPLRAVGSKLPGECGKVKIVPGHI